MNRYNVRFYGRENGALGVKSIYKCMVDAENNEDVVSLLYEKYEHISELKVNFVLEVDTPRGFVDERDRNLR